MSNVMLNEFAFSTLQTLYMTITSGIIAILFGIPLGVILFATRSSNIMPNKVGNRTLSTLTNIIRSTPFIILMVAIIPFTRLITGTSIGTTAAIIPLSIAAIPFIARMVEAALSEIAGGLIEAGVAMGSSPIQIIVKILIPEALAGIIKAITITLISLIGYSAMAGAIGGGGLGDLAIRYGYHRFNTNIMLATIAMLIIIVQTLQWLGDYCAKRYTHN